MLDSQSTEGSSPVPNPAISIPATAPRIPELGEDPEITKAFVAAQAEFQMAVKTAENTHLRTKYATLKDYFEAVLPVLRKHGFGFTQTVHQNGMVSVTVMTILLHGPTGKRARVGNEVFMAAAKADAHGIGGAITYAKRISFGTGLGIASDEEHDDDGNLASGVTDGKFAMDPKTLAESLAKITKAKNKEELLAASQAADLAAGRDVEAKAKVKSEFEKVKSALVAAAKAAQGEK